MKQPVLVFTAADKKNFDFTIMMLNSLRKFHDWPVVFVTDEKDPEKLKKLPKNVTTKDLEPYLKADPLFFYKQKPVIAEEYMKDYELVLGLDADQLILGDLSYILNTKDYDVGTVINWNRVDPIQMGGYVQGWGILPPEYFNCGLVAMRSEKFVHHWKTLCFTDQFERLQYKEQDLLNILCYYGNYNVRCFDHGDGPANYAWHGLIGKGEYVRAVLKDDKIIIPKGEGEQPFPGEDQEVKVIHFAGGQNNPQKGNYRTLFSEDIIKRIDYLVS
jgi:hypothetical protein